MDSKTFFEEVSKMRALQKDYFRKRDSIVLQACKKQEKLIDNEIDRVTKITEIIPTLFDN